MEDKQPYYGDLARTAILSDLFEVPAEQRSDAWRDALLANVAEASFACGDPQVITGPDGFPYFQLSIPEPGNPFECFVISRMAGDFLLQNGWGVVIHGHKAQPDWVFTHGDIVNYHLRGEFYSQVEEAGGEIGTKLLIAQPDEAYLPARTRGVMRSYLAHFGARDPKIVLSSRLTDAGATRELLFNLTPASFPDGTDYDGVMRSLGWFLPRGYRYSAAEEHVFGESFEEL